MDTQCEENMNELEKIGGKQINRIYDRMKKHFLCSCEQK